MFGRHPRMIALAVLVLAALFPAVVGAAGQGGQTSEAEAAAESGEGMVWSGEAITFTKTDGADPTVAENQDRITENVWITRSNEGGQIFNIKLRESPNKTESPVGTLWARGTTDDLPNLDFAPFRAAVGKPKTVAGVDLVMYLIEADAYVDVTFTSWSQEKEGGFSYERSTK